MDVQQIFLEHKKFPLISLIIAEKTSHYLRNLREKNTKLAFIVHHMPPDINHTTKFFVTLHG